MIRLLFLSLFWLVCADKALAETAKPKSPNVLFLFSDDQCADTIAALGNKQIRTPHLDQFVKDGTAFTRAYCMARSRAPSAFLRGRC